MFDWINRLLEDPQEPIGTPPNWPDPVPYEWCLERQKRVVGAGWRLSRSLVESSARELKDEIDFSREKFRAQQAQWDALRRVLKERVAKEQ